MKCLICEKDETRIMLLKLPLDVIYENDWLEIVGNVKPDEYICIACVGYQFDEMHMRKLKII
jgi:hypothetical protein